MRVLNESVMHSYTVLVGLSGRWLPMVVGWASLQVSSVFCHAYMLPAALRPDLKKSSSGVRSYHANQHFQMCVCVCVHYAYPLRLLLTALDMHLLLVAF